MLDVLEDQLCLDHFPSSQKLHILRSQTRSGIELFECVFQPPVILLLHALAEGAPCFLQFFL